MTECVVEVGPGTVRGPLGADADLMSTALECIDDEIAVLDEQPVAVSEHAGSLRRETAKPKGKSHGHAPARSTVLPSFLSVSPFFIDF